MIMARAPLRVSLGGGGTDLPSYYTEHGGFVVSAAINKYVYICLNQPVADDLIRVKYSRSEEVQSVDDVQHDLVRPALTLLGITRNIEIAALADIPAGTGLGSSSTYLVALLTALHELKRDRVPPHFLAELAFHVEAHLAGHPVGKQDHYLAAFGGITCLEIGRRGDVRVEPLPISAQSAEGLQERLLLFFTGVSRSADDILSEQDILSKGGDTEMIGQLHKTKAVGLEIRDALVRGDLDAFGVLMDKHWHGKRRRSSLVSDSRIDRWYETATAAGATGGKIVGAGGGGFLMTYCPTGTKQAVRDALTAEGLRETPFTFDYEGAKVLVNF